MLQDLENIRFFTDELPLDGDGDTAVMKADIVFGIKMEGYTSHRNCNGKVVKSEEWAVQQMWEDQEQECCSNSLSLLARYYSLLLLSLCFLSNPLASPLVP